ncbi:MAG: DEAD/DEAH box helicase, partial [Myxococcota bacterium]|nr:DEAD/DEAH box helicase [Myxococcota bacterium]
MDRQRTVPLGREELPGDRSPYGTHADSEKDSDRDDGCPIETDLAEASFRVLPARRNLRGPLLTDFQDQAVRALREAFAPPWPTKRRAPAGMLVLPTGGGKTLTALYYLAVDWLSRGKRVLWIAHRVHLLDQVYEHLSADRSVLAYVRRDLSVSLCHGRHDSLDGDFVLASAQKLHSIWGESKELPKDFDFVVIDEAHRGQALRTREKLASLREKGTPLLGLTATPFRATDEETAALHELFDRRIVYQISMRELIAKGFLAKPVFHRLLLHEAAQLSSADVYAIREQGEFTGQALRKIAESRARNREIVDYWTRRARAFGKTLVFACTIRHAEELAKAFHRRGFEAAVVHSRMNMAERERIVGAFRSNRIQVLTNVNVFSEGTDVPDIKTVLLARPTLSPVLYWQMIGRGARGGPGAPEKKEFHVVDCVDNFERHNLTLAYTTVERQLVEGEGLGDEVEVIEEKASGLRRRRTVRGAVLGAP